MQPLDRHLIAILAFAEAMRWPLTLMDIHERFALSVRPTVAELLGWLDALVADGTVRQDLGMYALAGTDEHIFRSRVEREKECAQKWRRMRRYAWWLQVVPYAPALLASGSLALGNTGPDSDWDVFVIARQGRLYTARAFLLAAARLMGRLRTKRDAVAPDRFCFNHYVTTDGLGIRHRSLYVAHALSALVPVHDPECWLEKLWQANRWMTERMPRAAGATHVRRTVRHSRLLAFVRRVLEWMLDAPIGGVLERQLARWQRARIQGNPATHASGGRVIADDREIEFHPRSAEATVLAAYNRALARHGLADLVEQDSGLTR